MWDRSSKASFAVSGNLKFAKYHFIEAKIDKLTESRDTTANSVSTSTWLCAGLPPNTLVPKVGGEAEMGGWGAMGDPLNNYISIVLLTLIDQM